MSVVATLHYRMHSREAVHVGCSVAVLTHTDCNCTFQSAVSLDSKIIAALLVLRDLVLAVQTDTLLKQLFSFVTLA